uniref:Uncharacterized protein n=1 Tax=Anguilla anguilla TaxID=7936 RepID=A0A0E9PKG1_ANGAN
MVTMFSVFTTSDSSSTIHSLQLKQRIISESCERYDSRLSKSEEVSFSNNWISKRVHRVEQYLHRRRVGR